MRSKNSILPLSVITPEPCSRSLIVGSVGSGKSSLGCALLESYHFEYQEHPIIIVDAKHRFVPVDNASGLLFPEGFYSRNHGRIDGVSVAARPLHSSPRIRKLSGVYLVQSLRVALELFDWLFDHSDVRKPVMIYNDESLDLHRNGLLDYRFKRIIQMGREKGLGHITINQRPKRIDITLISESERIYIGTLRNFNDRDALYKSVSVEDAKRLLSPLPEHVFWMIDQVRPSKSRIFTLSGV